MYTKMSLGNHSGLVPLSLLGNILHAYTNDFLKDAEHYSRLNLFPKEIMFEILYIFFLHRTIYILLRLTQMGNNEIMLYALCLYDIF